MPRPDTPQDSRSRSAGSSKSVTAYRSLLRNHIHKEDHMVFPMVQATLSDEKEEPLQAEFEKARQKAGKNTFENSHKLVVDRGSMLVHM